MQLAGYARVTSPQFRGDPQRPESWLQAPGEVLREMPGRRVFRATVDGQPVVIKLITPRRLRHFVRPYAQREAENALAVRERGLPVVEPLAYARLDDGRQILVLRDEVDALPLQQVIQENRLSGRARHALAKRVGALWAELQNAGIRHDDPHAANFLVRPDGSVLLTDAWVLRAGDYLKPKERAADLSQFALFFLTHAKLSDLLLFWGAYGRASSFLPRDLEILRNAILERVPQAFRRLAGSRARRARRHGDRVKVGAFYGLTFGDVPADVVEEVVASAESLKPGPHVLKQSPTAWTLVVRDEYVAKVFLPKKASRPFRDFVMGTRADRAVNAAEALLHRGLKTPEVVAVLRDGLLPDRSILLMRRVADARPLDEAAALMTPHRARETAGRLGRLLRRMHDWGLRHRDLKRDNLLVRADGEFVFLDLDGIRQTRRGKLDWERRARDLAQLDGSLLSRNRVPTGLRLRTLDAYLARETPPGFEPGRFARLVVSFAAASRRRRLER
ncbi:MAG: lipopolysaccharide kinase InaA family protein [Planctomycetota bacterium]|nr:lipopolysaccharide kinase InaA family protein [Planctomycetota bacterium]